MAQKLSVLLQSDFLIATLQAVQEACRLDGRRGSEGVRRVAQLLRAVADSGEGELWSFAEERKQIENLVELARLRFGERFRFVTAVPDADFRVPRLAVARLVANAIQYGVRIAEKSTLVRLEAVRRGGTVQITVEDGGKDFDDPAEREILELTRSQFVKLASGSLRENNDSISGRRVTVEFLDKL